MISVVVPTNRVGGLDILFQSLDAQTFQDFELILVDNILDYRSPALGTIRANFGFTMQAPRGNPFPNTAYCASMNTGIARARGDTCVFLCDYSWLAPDCLATHAACQAANPGPTHLDYNYCELPALADGLPFYGQTVPPDSPAYRSTLNATTARYVSDLADHALDKFMWSIFAEKPTAESVAALPVTHRHRPCATREAGDWNWCSFKNESFPTELLLEMNGLDERFDDSHCYQDLEFSYRLKARGIEWHNGPPETGMVTVVNPREVLNIKRMAKPISHNAELAKMAGHRLVNPGWSLRDWRKAEIFR
jgi:glycosyltransferase involved in cell wall biosynthesis